MGEQVGVASDGACEMAVVSLGESVVSQWIGRVTGTLEALEESDFQCAGIWFPLQSIEQALQFGSMTEIAGFHAVSGGQFTVFIELFRIGLFVNAVDVGLIAPLEMACHEFIGQEHQLLDQLVGDVVLDQFQLHGASLAIEPDFHLRHFQIKRPGGKAALAKGGGAVPGGMDTTAYFVVRGGLKQGKGLPVGEACRTPDDRTAKPDMADRAVAVNVCKDAEGKTILVGAQAAKTVTEIFRQHRNDAIGEIDAVAAQAGLLVEKGGRLHIMGDIGDVDGDRPTEVRRLHLDGIVKVPRVIGIDRDDIPAPQILAPIQIRLRDDFAELSGFLADRCGKFARQAVLVNHRKHIHTGGTRGSEHLDNAPLGIHMAVLPLVEPGHNLVSGLGVLCGGNIEIPREAGIIGDNMIEILGFLKRAHNRRASAFDNAQDLPLRPSVTAGTPMITGITDQTGHNFVTMQGGAEMIAGDEEILAPLLLGQDMTGAARMNLKLSGKEIRCLRDDIVIPPHTGELTLSFKPRERAVKIGNIMSIKSQCPRDGRSGKRIVLKQSEDRQCKVIHPPLGGRLPATRGGRISRAPWFLSGIRLRFPWA